MNGTCICVVNVFSSICIIFHACGISDLRVITLIYCMSPARPAHEREHQNGTNIRRAAGKQKSTRFNLFKEGGGRGDTPKFLDK